MLLLGPDSAFHSQTKVRFDFEIGNAGALEGIVVVLNEQLSSVVELGSVTSWILLVRHRCRVLETYQSLVLKRLSLFHHPTAISISQQMLDVGESAELETTDGHRGADELRTLLWNCSWFTNLIADWIS